MRWWRRSSDRDRSKAPIDDRLAKIADPTGQRLVEVLSEFHRETGDRDEIWLQPLMAAIDQLVVQWLDEHDRLMQAAADFEVAHRAEQAMRDRLQSLIDLVRRTETRASRPTDEMSNLLQTDPAGGAEPAGTDTEDQLPRQRLPRPDPPLPPPPPPPPPPFDGLQTSATAGAAPIAGAGSADPVLPGGPDTGLAAFLFGRLRVYLDGEPVEMNFGGKGLRVFRYLLAHRLHPAPKDVLIELFWPDSRLESGRRGLHQAIYTIRKALREATAGQLIVFDEDAYQIDPSLATWTDVDAFERQVEMGRREEAVAGDPARARELYRQAEQWVTGDFLEESPYEEWAIAERERLRLLYIDMANRLGELLEANDDLAAALEVSHRVLKVDRCDEESHRRSMRCYSALGHRSLAIRQYRTCADQLSQTYELSPSPETTELYESLIAG